MKERFVIVSSFKLFVFAFGMLVYYPQSCAQSNFSASSAKTIKVDQGNYFLDLIIKHDNCKLYRFYDSNPVLLTICRNGYSSISWLDCTFEKYLHFCLPKENPNSTPVLKKESEIFTSRNQYTLFDFFGIYTFNRGVWWQSILLIAATLVLAFPLGIFLMVIITDGFTHMDNEQILGLYPLGILGGITTSILALYFIINTVRYYSSFI